MVWNWPFRDFGWLSTVLWCIACVVLASAAIVFLMPHVMANFKVTDMVSHLQMILAACGCCLFFAGSVLACIDALNTNRRRCSAWTTRPDHPLPRPIKKSHLAPPYLRSSDLVLQSTNDSCEHLHDSYRLVAANPQYSVPAASCRGARIIRPELKEDRIWLAQTTRKELRAHLKKDPVFISSCGILLSSLIYCVTAWAAVGTTFT